MTLRRFRLAPAALILLPLLVLGACRPDESTDEPPETVQETPLEAAVVPEAVVGTYRLWQVNDEPLPGGAGQVDECEVQLTEGRLSLGSDALYELDVLARAVCDPDEDEEAQMVDRAISEGPYTVEGFEIRFDSEVTRADQEAWEGRLSEELVEDERQEAVEGTMDDDNLFDTETFMGKGTVRDSLLTVRLTDDLTTLTFVKE